MLDQQFPNGTLFISKTKENIKAYQYSDLKQYDASINPKALFFLMLSMPTHEECNFFEDYKDFVAILWDADEKELSEYLRKHWMRGDIADILWEVFDQED